MAAAAQLVSLLWKVASSIPPNLHVKASLDKKLYDCMNNCKSAVLNVK